MRLTHLYALPSNQNPLNGPNWAGYCGLSDSPDPTVEPLSLKLGRSGHHAKKEGGEQLPLFLTGHPILTAIWGPIVGPLVAIIAFVCSVGNIPLAAVLWNGGISFGGVLAFILADLIVLPILSIYRKYYGWRMAIFLLVTFYTAMAFAALVVEMLFGVAGLSPPERNALVVEPAIVWNYTTWLNIVFIVLAAILVGRSVMTGGIEMLRIMNQPGTVGAHHG